MNNWDFNGSPLGPLLPKDTRHTAIFGDAIRHSRTVFTDDPVTVKAVQFLNSNTYAVGGTGTINLNAGTSAPQAAIDVILGDHQFQTEVNLQMNTDVTIDAGHSLTFNNTLNLGGNTLTKLGDGDLTIRNTLVSGMGGTVNLQQGSISGNGNVGSDVNNSEGTISPGDSLQVSSQVPEPGTVFLIVIGTILFSLWRTRGLKIP